ncbi:RidA family protein [Pectobacterium wasabiae]|uniref:RidA family protein n=1 Tax=Pectobacterium wasabiae TaxID=55208 RepID=UPI00027B0CCE|nr:RidA family protein [Pectobacterium wasabiae]AOR65358.1 hypothetical protein A7983_19250 [Pectobacterium wasabiae CFBP 3304]EJS95775.1 YjgH protein [Pectobacterium wasabiae CFBP 3304]
MKKIEDIIMPVTNKALYERNRYSAAIKSSGFLFVSGQVGCREDGSPAPGLEQEVRLAFENLNSVLSAGGCSFADVVDVTFYLVSPEAIIETIWKVLPEFWGPAPWPAVTAVGVTWLSGFQFEIKVTARLPDNAL